MSYPFPPALAHLVGEQMATGKYSSEDELLMDAIRSLTKEDEDLSAVQEAIVAWQAGDQGVPLAEAFSVVRSDAGSDRRE